MLAVSGEAEGSQAELFRASQIGPQSSGGAMKIFALLTVIGIVALAMTVLLGFEEPNGILLLVSSILLFTAPAAMLVHLALTAELSHEERRIWLRALTGRRALAAWSLYLTCADRRDAIGRLAQPPPIQE